MDKPESIIGGLFGLENSINARESTPPFMTSRDVFFSNGRCGIWWLINTTRPRQVWIPSYLCRDGILEAIDPSLCSPRFYEVDYNLEVKSREWITEVSSGDLVIFIDYFGFPYDKRFAADVKEKGALILEDACQALLSRHVGEHSDFVLFNIVKWIGAPDGAILRCSENFPIHDIDLEMPAPEWWLKALQASVIRREFDDGINSREWFKLFREIGEAMPRGAFAMSQLAQIIMKHSVDYSFIAERRVNNYLTLLEQLKAYAVFPHLAPGIVPLGFPIRVDHRDSVRQALFDHNIYPPVHWLLENVIPAKFKDSVQLSKDIMTLPCDQRYTATDMHRMADVFLRSLNMVK